MTTLTTRSGKERIGGRWCHLPLVVYPFSRQLIGRSVGLLAARNVPLQVPETRMHHEDHCGLGNLTQSRSERDRQTDGQTDRRTDRQTDGRTDRQTEVIILVCFDKGSVSWQSKFSMIVKLRISFGSFCASRVLFCEQHIKLFV